MTGSQDENKECEQHEEERLAEVEGYIDRLAGRFSTDAPGQRDDLAQESRLRVLLELQKNPDCPESHLRTAAWDGVLQYRKRGKSIDGKINENGRSQTWDTQSLDAPATDNGTPLGAMLSEKTTTRRITEERALNRVQMDALREELGDEEQGVLAMRLNGARWQEVMEAMGDGAGRPGRPVRERLEEAAERVLTVEPSHSNNKNGGGRSF